MKYPLTIKKMKELLLKIFLKAKKKLSFVRNILMTGSFFPARKNIYSTCIWSLSQDFEIKKIVLILWFEFKKRLPRFEPA